MEILDGPRIDTRAERATLGIRRRVPFRGMLAERDQMLRELIGWLDSHGVGPEGPFFLRLHSIDMAAEMDVEVGVVSSARPNGPVQSGSMPAGRYAVLAYRLHSLQANRLLLSWAAEHDFTFDVVPTDRGDRWAGRFEIYLTDPRTEPRKTRWVTELAFLGLAD